MSDEIVRAKTVLPAAVAHQVGSAEPEIVYEVLAFVIAQERYALPLASVREILKVPSITEVPRAPRDVLGIISVRGRIITVVDLRRRLRMAEAAIDKGARVLLVDDGRELLGLLVDRVLSVYRLRQDEVELAAVMGGDTADYVTGIGRPKASKGTRDAEARTQEEMLILLDPGPLLRR